jgi:hypothetical protein
MLLWFVVLAVLGIPQFSEPGVLWALNPIEGFHFLTHHGKAALTIMGSVFLVVTGGRRFTPTWGTSAQTDLSRVDVSCVSGADFELPRPGRVHHRKPHDSHGSGESVFLHGTDWARSR